MSYDVLLVRRPGSSVTQSLEYFRSRPHYTVTETQAAYENPDTDVYFVFDTLEPDGSEPDSEDPEGTWLSFNLNLYRPSVFGIEAAHELLAVTGALESDVFDPQSSEPAVRPFAVEDFLATWNYANVQGHAGFLSWSEGADPILPPRTLQKKELLAVWEWNFSRQFWNDELGEQVFVPRILFFDGTKGVNTAVVWADAIPCMLPRVDRILLYRDALRPKKWLRKTKEPDLSDLAWADLAPFLPPLIEGQRPLPYYDLSAPLNATMLQRLIAQQPRLEVSPQRLALDHVHDNELLPGAALQ